ncbi:odorant receptor 82a-like [Belonocnema kinseyi]|uniref:odorant receptor 82a-like n=1 Tax=Belonocnema kinseyi TaxID=2817044 RepID=UPI00143D8E23|nr:odorant receptor 82a-like [Belonocnema kinseyi]
MENKRDVTKKDVTTYGFSVNKFVLSVLGQWPYQTKIQKLIIRIIGNTIMSLANLTSLIALYDVRNDFDAVIERVPMFMTGVFYFINFFTLVSQSTKLKTLLDDIKNSFRAIKRNSEEEEQILIQSAKEGNLVLFCYIFLMASFTVLYCLATLTPVALDLIMPLNESRTTNFIYDVNYVFLEKEDHYYFIFCHSTIAGVYCIGTVMSFDMMLYLFAKHVNAMFRVLRHRLKNLVERSDINQNFAKEDYKSMEKGTISCIKLYNDIIVFTNNVESCFATCLTFTMGVSAVIMCFQGVMIVVRIDQPDQVIMFATYFMSQAIHLFFDCFSGEMLVTASGSVSNYIYNTNWYVMPQKQKKLLLMMMLRSINDCHVTIGKFLILNNETYSKLMKTVFSYLSVLMSVRE